MILKPDTISKIVQEGKGQGKTFVFTNGCFDIIHPGHVRYLKESKKLGDYQIVALNSDDSVRRLKGESRPINSLEDRAEVMASLSSVDFVTFFDEDTPKEVLDIIRPNILTKGGDYVKEDVVGYELLKSYGGVVVILSFVDGKSTTNIIEKSKA
ncbi:MAG: D-glycero-beta-D-manno-heptose 1-phosphate adenylyltransferase [Candidatus Kapaibacteriales bacterium]